MIKKSLALFIFLTITCSPRLAMSQNEFDIKAFAKDMEKHFEACPKREVVAQFERKHHKQVWVKEAWGSPTEVFADAKVNDSVLHPYILTVDFALAITWGPEHESKADAEKDTTLVSIPLAGVSKTKYRNIYLAGKDDLRPKSRQLLNADTQGWVERPSWPDACWDQIGAK